MPSVKNGKKLILVALNEINFSVVEGYLRKGLALPSLSKLVKSEGISSASENEYNLLEPWIQWPSVYTGLRFAEHGVFRLGDAKLQSNEQIFETLEERGLSVGAISPMNASNRLKNAAYFISDPWTGTESSGPLMMAEIAKALRQTVNDNSKNSVSFLSYLRLIIAFVIYVPVKFWMPLARLVVSSKGKRWRRAIFLDSFLSHLHDVLWRQKKPDFSIVFLNAGAHIQHHYFHNSFALFTETSNPDWYVSSADDPLAEVLSEYDRIIGRILADDSTDVIIATGLSQRPTQRPIFYYRLSDHAAFLKGLDIAFEKIEPRMTRDFLITFASGADAQMAAVKLAQIRLDNGTPIFGVIDNRGHDLFVTLTLDTEVKPSTRIYLQDRSLSLKEHVVFVALKNGEHEGRGSVFMSDDLKALNVFSDGDHVAGLHELILKYFD